MKKLIMNANFHMAVLIGLSVVMTVVMSVCCDIKWYVILLLQVASLLAALLVRFAYPIANQININQARLFRKSQDVENDEPSELLIIIVKLIGYAFLFTHALFLFFTI